MPGVSINYSPGSLIPVIVPSTINHIIGYEGAYTGDGSRGIYFQVNAGSSTPLVIDRFGAGALLLHNSPRTVVMTDGQYGSYASTSSGTIHLVDTAFIGPTVTLQTGQTLLARQLNIEPTSTDKLLCGTNTTMVILGYKTERTPPSLTLSAGCQANIFGSLFYPLSGGTTLISATDAAYFINVFELVYGAGQGSTHLVTETQSGVTRNLNPTDVNSSQNLNMYYSVFSAPPVTTPVSVTGSVVITGGSVTQ